MRVFANVLGLVWLDSHQSFKSVTWALGASVLESVRISHDRIVLDHRAPNDGLRIAAMILQTATLVKANSSRIPADEKARQQEAGAALLQINVEVEKGSSEDCYPLHRAPHQLPCLFGGGYRQHSLNTPGSLQKSGPLR